MKSKVATTAGVVSVLEAALARARTGRNAGVTIIEYARDGSWNSTSAGLVLRSPAVGVAAAQLLSSQFVRRLETEDPMAIRPERRS